MTLKPIRLLVTGFAGFPGARRNPTSRLIHALSKHKSRLARFGVEIELHVLPVVYAAIAPRLRYLADGFKPDAILHFGLAARRKEFCVETRALNRMSIVHPDAAGAMSGGRSIIPGGALVARATFPSDLIVAAILRAGIRARLSIDAGDYVCNQTLYLSLATTNARSIGFIHMPRLARRGPSKDRRKDAAADRRPTFDDAMRAALIAILVTVAKLRRTQASKLQSGALLTEAEALSRQENAIRNAKSFHVCDEMKDAPLVGRASA